MPDYIERIEDLDITLFDPIPSQTSHEDKRSLLTVQRAVAGKHKEYVYLEIGSHLGGSIQPHLLDNRCKKIYSIDPRPPQQPDDGSPGHIAYYENNSSERMLALLGDIDRSAISKIECFGTTASSVHAESISVKPNIVFIDGEHTKSAVISDFMFCEKVISDAATVLFHDFDACIQPVSATREELKTSAGVLNPRHFLGR